MTYELQIGEDKIKGDISDLKELAYTQDKYFEIYKIIPSKINNKKIKRRALLMNIKDMIEAKRLRERGYTYEIICRKFNVGVDYLRKVLRQMNTNTQHV